MSPADYQSGVLVLPRRPPSLPHRHFEAVDDAIAVVLGGRVEVLHGGNRAATSSGGWRRRWPHVRCVSSLPPSSLGKAAREGSAGGIPCHGPRSRPPQRALGRTGLLAGGIGPPTSPPERQRRASICQWTQLARLNNEDALAIDTDGVPSRAAHGDGRMVGVLHLVSPPVLAFGMGGEWMRPYSLSRHSRMRRAGEPKLRRPQAGNIMQAADRPRSRELGVPRVWST